MSEQLEKIQSYGHKRLQQGGKAAIVVVVVVVIALLLCVCATVGGLVLFGPTIGDILSQLFVPV